MKALLFQRHVVAFWVLCLVLGLVLAYLFRSLNDAREDSGATLRVQVAASLAEPDCVFFLHLPSLNEAEDSFTETDLSQLWHLPGMRHFFALPLAEVPGMAVIQHYWKHCRKLEATEALLTFNYIGAEPTLTAAFKSNGEIDALRESMSAWLQEACGEGALSEEVKQEATIHRVEGKRGAIAQVRWNGWYLTGTHEKALWKMLTRLQETQPARSLADHGLFQQALKTLPRDYVALAYLRASSDAERKAVSPKDSEDSVSPIGRQFIRRVKRAASGIQSAELQAIAMTSSFRDGKMVDQTSVISPKASKAVSYAQKAMPLTSPDTLAFLGGSVGAKRVLQQFFRPFTAGWETLVPELEFENAFGVEWSLQIEPLADEEAETGLVMSFDLADGNRLLSLLEKLGSSEGSGLIRASRETFQLESARLTDPFKHFMPEAHLQITHGLLVMADSAPALHQVVRRWNLPEHLDDRSDFRRLRRRLAQPDLGMAFFDTERLLQNGYDALQHPLVLGTLWMTQRSQTSLNIDLGSMPHQANLSSLRLTPTYLTVHRAPWGYRKASMGSLSPLQWATGGSLLAALIDKTFAEAAPQEPDDPFLHSLDPEEILDLIE